MNTIDIFLSHNSRDKPLVRELVTLLEKQDVNVWFDEDDLLAGVAWIPELESTIEESAVFIAALGGAGIGPWQQPEIETALMQSVDRQVPVIPLLLPNGPENANLPSFLKRFTWVDFREGFNPKGIDRILKTVQLGRSLQSNSTSSTPNNNKSRSRQSKHLLDFKTASLPSNLIAWWPLAAIAMLSLITSFPFYESWGLNILLSLIGSVIFAGTGYACGQIFFRSRHALGQKRLIGLAVAFLVLTFLYLAVYTGFSEVSPSSYSRNLTGSFSQEFRDVLEFNAGNQEKTKNDFEFDPQRIYTSTSLFCVLISLVTTWFASAILCGTTVAGIQWMRAENRTSDSNEVVSLRVLDLPESTFKKLRSMQVETIGDLIAMNARQLKTIGNLEDDDIDNIENILAFTGLRLRKSR